MIQWIHRFVQAKFNTNAQTVFFLKTEYPDMTYAEISRRMGINPETVRVIYQKIMDYLRYVLEHGKEPESQKKK